jgi:small GTP-binding protein
MSKEQRPFYIFKICLLGEGGVGKTCLARRLCFNTFDMDTKLTIGIDFYTYDIPIKVKGGDNDFIRLTIWDFGGQEAFKRLFPYYINGANGLFMVFDLSDMNTMTRLGWWYDELLKIISGTVPRILIGSKYDKVKKRELKKDKLIVDRFMKTHNDKTFIQTSSKENYNVNHIFIELTKVMLDIHNLSYEKLG